MPAALAAEMSHADALGQQAWQEARAASDFSRFRDALARHVELRHRYVECFEAAAHPYDILLDDFEPGLTTAELRPLFATLRDALVGLVAAAAGDGEQARNDGAFSGPFEVDDQRRAVMAVLEAVGFDPDGWRLDPAPHPFAQSLGPQDVRITTRYDLHDFGVAHFSALHEFGHGLYEAGIAPELARSPLGAPVSLGIHESQSRLWENLVGPLAPVLRLGAADACASTLGPALGGDRRRGALPRGQLRPALADPRRRRRDDLQPPHHPALRARAGADRGHARGRRPPGGLERGHAAGCSASRCPTTRRACCRTSTGAPGCSATSRPTRSGT